MKKKSVLLVLVLLVLSLLTTGCGTKTPITVEDFKNEMTKREYKIVEKRLLSDYTEANDIVSAEISENNYIELFDMKTEADAEQFYNLNENYFEQEATSHTTVTYGNYSKFAGTVNDQYIVYARIDNTILYVEAETKNKDIVNKVVKEIGY